MVLKLGTKGASVLMTLIRQKNGETHDCAFLLPLAFPPDLPPVILMDLLMKKSQMAGLVNM